MKKNVFKVLFVMGIVSMIGLAACSNNEGNAAKDEKGDRVLEGKKVQDGTYVGNFGDLVIENTFKGNTLVKRVVNGEEINVQNAPHQGVYLTNEEAMNVVGTLDKAGTPCITSYRVEGSAGETLWMVEYGDEEPCWYEKYR